VSHSIASEWRAFREDEPGARFSNHHVRMRRYGTRAGAIARIGLGVLLVAAGIVMLFAPGPGLLVALFGFGLLGGESAWLADRLDRVEPAMRRGGRALVSRWRQLGTAAQVAVVTFAVIAVTAAAYLVWRWWT
jgi:hypothetical protein